MTDPQNGSGMPPLPAPQTGAEIYNNIMVAIEPELTTDQIPLMAEKYRDETEEQRKARGERYARAYEEYERRYAQYLLKKESEVRAFRLGSIRFVERKAAETDQRKLKTLESSLSTAA